MNRFLFLTLIVISCLSFYSQKSFAASLEENEKALNMIADFADRLCKDIPLQGHGDNLELTGSAKVELNGIIKKLANLGLDGAIKYQNTEYEGLLQKDLVSALRDKTKCRLQVWNDLKDKLISSNTSTIIIRPNISSFESSPQQITNGASTTLMWKVNNANSVEITPGIGTVALEGRRALQPSSTTTYTLTAQNAGGITSATHTITVLPRKRLYIRAVTSSPYVALGERVTIYVTASDENGQVVPGTMVLVSARWGKFLESEAIAYNQQSSLRGPSSVSGHTDSNGVYTAWWVICGRCKNRHGMSIKASKEGYMDASGELSVNMR